MNAPSVSRPGVAVALTGPRPPSAHPSDAADAKDLTLLRRLLWFYIALWITEGALRKWILPGMAAPLLVIRDPVLLFMYYVAFTKGLFPRGVFVASVIVLGAIALMVSVAATDTPILIEIYGLRASYLHLLLIFLIPKILDLDDVRRLGKWVLLASGPMALLVLLQFLAGRGSSLNAGAGGVLNSMIESAYGHIRPSGTFSFTNGLTGFTAIVAVYFLYHLLEKGVYPRVIWLVTAPALVVLIVLSGSRSAAGLVFLIMATVTLIGIVHSRYRAVTFRLGALVGVLFLAAGSFAVFKQGMDVFAYRFGDAANVRVGFLDRFFDSYKVPFIVAEQAPLLGTGLGMGTNVAGGVILGHAAFLLSEGELARDILESGPLIGGLYLLLRACMVVYLGSVSMRSLFRDVNPMPLLIFSSCFIDLLQGQFSQPTELGFATIACGLCLAASRSPSALPGTPAAASRPSRQGASLAADRVAGESVAPAVAAPPPVRGRSAYAERLHGGDGKPVPPVEPANPPS